MSGVLHGNDDGKVRRAINNSARTASAWTEFPKCAVVDPDDVSIPQRHRWNFPACGGGSSRRRILQEFIASRETIPESGNILTWNSIVTLRHSFVIVSRAREHRRKLHFVIDKSAFSAGATTEIVKRTVYSNCKICS